MELEPYVAQIREGLSTAVSAADVEVQRTAAVLAGALEPAVRLALMTALSDLAAEVTAAWDDGVVEVRLDGRDVRVVVTRTDREAEEPDGAEAPPPPPPPDGGDISRITLRLLDEIKTRAERAASAQGVSLNTWVSQAVQGALQGAQGRSGRPPRAERPEDHGRPGSRVRGWVVG
ncbi:HicB family protein [Streptoalloteichus tenebrarius]|uniref:HicB family protein n=1 Tax=Streptoalloteichus tenebrarius (strain ATCC 17920 / DSM 40477 / JCM 4838 / CBS 697.72 / NBRC 16177 / NCIMB 11028 / NRRL B-12390 / A12253. 1 / ISP 5477) TaxID=1933 RepID=A0ABT1HN27_STRSD|nr:toxin-antitoxin system HicB family antitoxin [Streptoalloteichus tenebrarius]MCP2256922.1 HicB family protein [Streptoalloteichus tenebrarius]BFF00169.1 toxin-antitoxin system HicB family antitoxin [Streptoalloteichus tenebrarius]